MSATDALVRRAARRWPADVQAEMTAEWLAELAAMRREHVPAWRRMAYAMCLLVSAPVEEAGAPPRVWREELPSLGRAAAELTAFVAVACGAAFTASLLPTFANFLFLQARGDYPSTYIIGEPTSVQWAANAVAVSALTLACAGFGWLGTLLGRMMPLRWARHTSLGATGPAVVAAFVLGASLIGMFRLYGVAGYVGVDVAPGVMPAVALWTVLALLVAICAGRLTRRRLAIAIGVLGNLVALDIVGILVASRVPVAVAAAGIRPWWFPLSLLDLEHSGVAYGDAYTYDSVVNAVGSVSRPMLVCAAFLLCYGLRASRALPIAPTPRPITSPFRTSAVPVRHAVAVTLMAAGLALWTYTDAWLTPAVERITNGDSDPGELHIWVQEQRELAIGLTVVALILAIIGRGPVAVPAVIAYAGLFITDCVVDARGLSGRHTAAVMLAVGAAVLGTAWWLPRRLSVRPADPLVTRRVGATVAIGAALLTPALYLSFTDAGDFKRVPGGLIPSGLVVMALMWCAAVAVASTARKAPLSWPAAAVLMVIPLAALFGVGTWREALDQAAPVVAAPLLAVVVLALIRGRATFPLRRWVLLVLASLVTTIPYVLASIMVAMAFGGALMAAAGFEYPSDGVPFLPGALPIAVGAGLLLARVAVPRPPALPQSGAAIVASVSVETLSS